MFIAINHTISDPGQFWTSAEAGLANLPEGIKIIQVLPSPDGASCVCLWEGESVDAIKNLVEPMVGAVSKNDYFEVEPSKAIGFPVPQTA